MNQCPKLSEKQIFLGDHLKVRHNRELYLQINGDQHRTKVILLLLIKKLIKNIYVQLANETQNIKKYLT